MNTQHQPVMLEQVISLLKPKAGEAYLDLTAGFGGHAAAIAKRLGTRGHLTLVDRDQRALADLKQRFPDETILKSDYESAVSRLKSEGSRFDMILMDLGLSSPQLEAPDRGFSFGREGPLDMRMDQSQRLSAEQIVNHYREQELADLIYRYGEERASRRIARQIVAVRPLKSTLQLAEVVARAIGRRGKIHPATRTFQALRVAVNDELGQLERTLPHLPELLNPSGRLLIISFHSLEDRIVKHWLKASELEILTKKPLLGKTYDTSNRRARSAKLRAAVKKIKTVPD